MYLRAQTSVKQSKHFFTDLFFEQVDKDNVLIQVESSTNTASGEARLFVSLLMHRVSKKERKGGEKQVCLPIQIDCEQKSTQKFKQVLLNNPKICYPNYFYDYRILHNAVP